MKEEEERREPLIRLDIEIKEEGEKKILQFAERSGAITADNVKIVSGIL